MNTRIMLGCLLFPLALSAQEPDMSLLSGDKVWTMQYTSSTPPEYGGSIVYSEQKLTGDTLIAGVNYREIIKRYREEGDTEYGEWQSANLFLGQAGSKVYLYSSVTERSRLIMDFSAEELSTVHIGLDSGDETDFLVTSASDTTLVTPDGAFTRRCIHLQSAVVPRMTDVWVSGVGSLVYGIISNIGAHGAKPQLWKLVSDGKTIYQCDQTTVGISNAPHLKLNKPNSTCYNLQGSRISGQPRQSGMYIQDGRKLARLNK